MQRLKIAVFLLLFLLPCLGAALPFYGATLSSVIVNKDPSSLYGYPIAFIYDPDRFKWRKFNIYFEASFSHFSVSDAARHSSISIYAIAPVIRYTFKKRGPISPFLEISIGASYLNQTRLADRNLGMHFAFQDKMGIGGFIGSDQQFSLGIHLVHYSNAHLAAHNSGISIPLLVDIGYRFN